jgi:hypothetical protein
VRCTDAAQCAWPIAPTLLPSLRPPAPALNPSTPPPPPPPPPQDQAIDRAHRIGQTRAVTVTRITVPGTVEDRIMKLQVGGGV